MTHSKHHRRSTQLAKPGLAVVLCLALGALIIVCGLAVNWFTDTPVLGSRLALAVGTSVALFALYLWFRLSR